MSPEMTKHYSAHATLEDKRRGMQRLAFFTPKALPNPEEEPERARFRQLADTLPIETIKKIITEYKGV